MTTGVGKRWDAALVGANLHRPDSSAHTDVAGEPTSYSFYNESDPDRWGREGMSAEAAMVERWLRLSRKDSRWEKVIELGCGKGALQNVHPNYLGIDIAFTPLKRCFPRRNCLQASIQDLPIKTGSVGFLFSFATIEHVPLPDKVLAEIDRVLSGGGVAIIAPAWFCRPWAAKGLPIRPYRDLPLADKIRKALIPLRDNVVWRAMGILPRRILREIAFLCRSEHFRFSCDRLQPNLSDYIYTDCDAFTSMDPHAAILFFLSRGYEILSVSSLVSRVLVKNEPVIVRKPS